MAEPIQTNDVKRGWQVKYHLAGLVAKVCDNRKGNLRMIQFLPGQGMFDDIGDDYVFRWAWAREKASDPWRPIRLTREQLAYQRSVQQQEDEIRGR